MKKSLLSILGTGCCAVLLTGCMDSEPSGKYQCEVAKELAFLIDSKNKTWDMFIGNDGSMLKAII